MKPPTLNAILLDQTMHHIAEVLPQGAWDQATLGVTTDAGDIIADFPGWAVMLAEPGQRPPRGYQDSDGTWVPRDSWILHGIWAPAYAARILGLTVEQRTVFFHSRWGLEALQAGVNALVRSDGGIGAELLQRIMTDEDVAWHPAR